MKELKIELLKKELFNIDVLDCVCKAEKKQGKHMKKLKNEGRVLKSSAFLLWRASDFYKEYRVDEYVESYIRKKACKIYPNYNFNDNSEKLVLNKIEEVINIYNKIDKIINNYERTERQAHKGLERMEESL